MFTTKCVGAGLLSIFQVFLKFVYNVILLARMGRETQKDELKKPYVFQNV